MKYLMIIGTCDVFKASNSFGDQILMFKEQDGGDTVTLTFQEGSWEELSEENLTRLYKMYL